MDLALVHPWRKNPTGMHGPESIVVLVTPTNLVRYCSNESLLMSDGDEGKGSIIEVCLCQGLSAESMVQALQSVTLY